MFAVQRSNQGKNSTLHHENFQNSCGTLSSITWSLKHCCCLLLFQQTDRYRFSSPHLSNRRQIQMMFLCTAIVLAVQSRALLCADVCGLLLFQQAEVERCSVQMSADCYCFSGPKSRVARFSCPKSSIALRRCLRTAIALAVECWTLIGRKFYRLLLFQQSPLHHLSSQARVQVDESCADNMCSLTRLNQLRVNIHRVSSTFRTLRQLSQILRNFPNFSATFPIGSA